MKFKESVFYFEYNRFMAKNKYYLAIILVLLLSMAQINFEEIKNHKQEIINIKQKEKLRMQKQTNSYQLNNINLYSTPTDTLFLLNFKAYNNLNGTISTESTCKIYEGKKNSGMNYLSGGYLSYSGILFLFLSLISISSGCDIFEKKQLTKFLCSIKKQNYHRITSHMALSRIILLLIFTTITLSSTMILAYINGIISMEMLSTLNLLLLSILVTGFFLFLGGAVTTLISKRGPRLVTITASYIMMVAVFPWSISKIPANMFHTISESDTEEQQIKILHIANLNEKPSPPAALKEKAPKGVRVEGEREKGDLIESIEMDHQERIIGKINDYRKMSMLLPSTLFLATANELSGYGVNNYCDFYRFLETRRREFHGTNMNKINRVINETPAEWFNRDQANIFKAQPELPRYYFTGVAFTFLYIGILGFLAFHLGHRRMFPVKRKNYGIDTFEIKKKCLGILFIKDKGMSDRLFGLMMGKHIEDMELYILKRGGRRKAVKNGFLYLVSMDYFQFMNSRALRRFLFGKDPAVMTEYKPELIYKYASKQRTVIVMDEFLTGLDPVFIESVKADVACEGLLCFVVTSDFYLARTLLDTTGELFYFENDIMAKKVIDTLGAGTLSPQSRDSTINTGITTG